MKTFICTKILILCLCCAVSTSSETIIVGGADGIDPYNTGEHYSILLALSGGGARGLASIGLIKAFEEHDIRIEAVAGTSIGGIIGGLYACGYTPDQLSSIIDKIDFDVFFTNAPERQTMFLTQRQEHERHLFSVRFDALKPVIPKALTGGQKITAVLTELTTKANYQAGGDFARLQIPFRTVATDVVTGEEAVLDSGSLANAMRASMAFPLAVTGVERNGRLLMDGGMVTPIPVDLVREMSDSVKYVVAVNTVSKLRPKNELVTPFDIAGQVTTIMTADQLNAQLKKADLIIEPALDGLESADFKFKDSLIAIGYKAGQEAADNIVAALSSRGDKHVYRIDKIEFKSNPSSLALTIKEGLINQQLSQRQLTQKLKEVVREQKLFRIEASVEPISDSKSTSRGSKLTMTVQERFPVSELTVKISGNTIYDTTTLLDLFLEDISYLALGDFKRGLERIVEHYRTAGYDVAFIRKVEVDYESKTIRIEIDEAIIRGVDIEENSRTKDWLIRSYFPLQVGQPYSTRKASEGLDNIYGTNLFDQVTVDLVPYKGGARVKIRVKEKPYTQLRIGWHWHDEYNSEQFVEVLDDNIKGAGLEYLLHAQYAQEQQKYFARLKMDRIWFTYITARITAYYDLLDRSVFDGDGKVTNTRSEKRTGFEISLGQQIARFGTVRGSFVFEELRNSYDSGGQLDKFGQRYFRFESQVETFDRVPFPRRGKRHLIEVRLTGKFLGGDIEYTRFFSSLEGYIAIGKYVNLHPKISLGISRSGLPPSEQFYLGGARSFVGFRTNQLVGDKMILFNSEMRFKLPLSLYLIGRYDFGEVYHHTDQIKLRNLRHGGGAFMSFDSPIGPFEFGYGIADSDNDRFYVNVGVPF